MPHISLLSQRIKTTITITTTFCSTLQTPHIYKYIIILSSNMSFLRRLVGGGSSSACKEQVNKIIADNRIAVFTKSWCPYCKQTVERLKQLKAEFYEAQLDKLDEGEAMQNALEEISGQRTVPNIYINQKHIGGNSDFQKLSEKEITA